MYERVTFKCRKLKEYSFGSLNQKLAENDWSEFYQCVDIEKAWNIMYAKFLATLDKICPETTFERVPKKSEWLTAAILELMKSRDNLFKQARKNINKNNSEDLWTQAREARNSTNDACKTAKDEFVKQKLIQHEGNPKKFWEHLKPLVHSDSKCKRMDVEIELDNHPPGNIPEAFNTYFTGIGLDLSKKI